MLQSYKFLPTKRIKTMIFFDFWVENDSMENDSRYATFGIAL